MIQYNVFEENLLKTRIEESRYLKDCFYIDLEDLYTKAQVVKNKECDRTICEIS